MESGDPQKQTRMAECHPDRKHYCRGKCSSCYYKARYAGDPQKYRALSTAYVEANTEKVSASRKAAYAANPEKGKLKSREYQKNNRAKVKAAKKAYVEANPECKLGYQLSGYGVSIARFKAMVESQGGLCLICHEGNLNPKRRLAVDHCHDTGKVRGLLCGRCNTAVGQLRNRPELARAVATYIEVCS